MGYYLYWYEEWTIMKARIAITLDEDVLERLDKKRGREKRSTFIEYLLRRSLNEWYG